MAAPLFSGAVLHCHLQAMAKSVLQELKKRWPDVKHLELYPAFAQ